MQQLSVKPMGQLRRDLPGISDLQPFLIHEPDFQRNFEENLKKVGYIPKFAESTPDGFAIYMPRYVMGLLMVDGGYNQFFHPVGDDAKLPEAYFSVQVTDTRDPNKKITVVEGYRLPNKLPRVVFHMEELMPWLIDHAINNFVPVCAENAKTDDNGYIQGPILTREKYRELLENEPFLNALSTFEIMVHPHAYRDPKNPAAQNYRLDESKGGFEVVDAGHGRTIHQYGHADGRGPNNNFVTDEFFNTSDWLPATILSLLILGVAIYFLWYWHPLGQLFTYVLTPMAVLLTGVIQKDLQIQIGNLWSTKARPLTDEELKLHGLTQYKLPLKSYRYIVNNTIKRQFRQYPGLMSLRMLIYAIAITLIILSVVVITHGTTSPLILAIFQYGATHLAPAFAYITIGHAMVLGIFYSQFERAAFPSALNKGRGMRLEATKPTKPIFTIHSASDVVEDDIEPGDEPPPPPAPSVDLDYNGEGVIRPHAEAAAGVNVSINTSADDIGGLPAQLRHELQVEPLAAAAAATAEAPDKLDRTPERQPRPRSVIPQALFPTPDGTPGGSPKLSPHRPARRCSAPSVHGLFGAQAARQTPEEMQRDVDALKIPAAQPLKEDEAKLASQDGPMGMQLVDQSQRSRWPWKPATPPPRSQADPEGADEQNGLVTPSERPTSAASAELNNCPPDHINWDGQHGHLNLELPPALEGTDNGDANDMRRSKSHSHRHNAEVEAARKKAAEAKRQFNGRLFRFRDDKRPTPSPTSPPYKKGKTLAEDALLESITFADEGTADKEAAAASPPTETTPTSAGNSDTPHSSGWANPHGWTAAT